MKTEEGLLRLSTRVGEEVGGRFQQLRGTGGAAEVGFDGGTAQDVLDYAKPMRDYSALRAYAGRAKGARITGAAIEGTFQRDDDDRSSADDGGTVIVDAENRRWKRAFAGPAYVEWFGAKAGGVVECGAALQRALDYGGELRLRGRYLTAQKLHVKMEGTRLVGPAAMWGSEVERGAGFLAGPTLDADFLLEFKNPNRPNHRSIGMQHVSIDCGASNAGGLSVFGAYDSSEFEHINITNVPGGRIGFLASAGNPTMRSGVIQTTAFRSIWVIKRRGTSTVPAIRTFGIQESEFVNCKASHSSAAVAAWELVSNAGLMMLGCSFVNPTGPGLDIIENFGPNDGVTIDTPTFENCKGTVRVYSKDAYLLGSIAAPPAIGAVVQRPADGSAAKGVVWQGTAGGVYVKDVTGVFAAGQLHDAAGVPIGTVSAPATAFGNNAINLRNPRVIGGASVGAAAGGSFKSLRNSYIELPDDPVTAYLHAYTTDDSVSNCRFVTQRPAQMLAPGKLNSVEGIADIRVNYPENWPWPTQTVRLTSFPRANRVTFTKSNAASFLSILPTTGTVNGFGNAEFRLFQGSVTFVRTGTTSWVLEGCAGSVFVIGVGRLSELKRFSNFTAAATAVDTSVIDGAHATNTGATATVNLNIGAIGAAVLLGTKFTMTRTTNFPFRAAPNAADIILGASAPGKYLELSTVGSSITLECIALNTYAVVASSGGFSFQS